MRFYAEESILLYDYIKTDLSQSGVFNLILNKDVNMFVNVLKIKETDIPEFKNSYSKIENYFQKLYDLLEAADEPNLEDTFFKEAYKIFNFPEPNELCLGYSSNNFGGGWGNKTKLSVLTRAFQIIKKGCKNPKLFELVGLFCDNVATDRISDMFVNIIRDDFIAFTLRLIKEYELDNKGLEFTSEHLIKKPEKDCGIFFVPSSFLSNIPIAYCWEDINRVAAENEIIKCNANSIVKKLWKDMDSKHRKETLFNEIFMNPNVLPRLFDEYGKAVSEEYNPELDDDTYYVQKRINSVYQLMNRSTKELLSCRTSIDLANVCIERFKHFVEHNGGRDMICDAVSGKKEKTAQGLLFAIAKTLCDLRGGCVFREVNDGRGACDFVFVIGNDKTLVEIKNASSNQLVHGYETQIEEYAKAEETQNKIYLIAVDEKNETLKNLLEKNSIDKGNGLNVPTIMTVDSFHIDSASVCKKE